MGKCMLDEQRILILDLTGTKVPWLVKSNEALEKDWLAAPPRL
jgi:hypothetical protein